MSRLPQPYWLVGLLYLPVGSFAQAGATAEAALHIDVFTTSIQPVIVGTAAANPAVALQIAEVDALERLDVSLSEGLSPDPVVAQREVQRRLNDLDQAKLATLRRSAVGLALAAQLGIDRTPAIVFNQTAVIYGITDLTVALRHYQAWAAEPN